MRVLVVGDVMLDRYLEGPPRFVSQEAPVIVVGVERKFDKLGGAGNSAENIKALGGVPVLAGVLGNHVRHDDAGRSLLHALRESNLSRAGLFVEPERSTTVKTRVLARGQQLLRVDEEQSHPVQKKTERVIIAFCRRQIPRVQSVLVSDYNKGVITLQLMRAIKNAAKQAGVPIIVDPRPQHRELYRGVTCITPNEVELSNFFGRYEVDERQLIPFAKRLRTEYSIACVVLTRGPKGMDILADDARVHHAPALTRHAVDVSGAGDTVAALVALAWNHLPPPDLALLASYAAKLSVEQQGTATVSATALAQSLQRPP